MEFTKPLYIAVDFDGTIVEHRYPEIGPEIPFAIDTLKLIQSELKHSLILWTVREGQELEDAVNFCKERGLHFYAVNSNYPREKPLKEPRKLLADLFIDDRNFGGMPDWGFIFNSLKHHPQKCLSQDIYRTHTGDSKPKKWRLFK
ncbi:MAG: hypothetical protein WC960_05935 [Bacteroidales bacterium]